MILVVQLRRKGMRAMPWWWHRPLYGDWRSPHTPAERKSKEHVAILDLEQSYTEHLDEQRSMRVDQYTKSIR